MEEVVKALQARLEDESEDEEQDDPTPDVAPAVAPAVANPEPARERWIDDIRQVRLDKEEDEFVVKIHKSFLKSIKEVKMSRDGKEFKMEAGFLFRSASIDDGVKNPSSQKYFLVGDAEDKVSVFPSLTSIHKKYKNNMNAIMFILPVWEIGDVLFLVLALSKRRDRRKLDLGADTDETADLWDEYMADDLTRQLVAWSPLDGRQACASAQAQHWADTLAHGAPPAWLLALDRVTFGGDRISPGDRPPAGRLAAVGSTAAMHRWLQDAGLAPGCPATRRATTCARPTGPAPSTRPRGRSAATRRSGSGTRPAARSAAATTAPAPRAPPAAGRTVPYRARRPCTRAPLRATTIHG
eukprot:g14099.t1